MKRSVSILLAALTLALALSSCGSKNSGNTTDDSHQQESGMLDRDDNTVTAPDTNPGQSPANTDESVTEGVPMDQMLENAKARDRDGRSAGRRKRRYPRRRPLVGQWASKRQASAAGASPAADAFSFPADIFLL